MSRVVSVSTNTKKYTCGSDKAVTLTETIEKLDDGSQRRSVKTEGTKLEDLPEDLRKQVEEEIKGTKKLRSRSPSPVEVELEASDDESFEKDVLKAHNDYRKKHGVAPLKISKELTKYAKEWAEKLAKEDKFEHRKEHKYGENIFCKWSSQKGFKISGQDATDSWYSEIKDYDFDVEPKTLKSGHFTQMIWKDSTEMGCAKARSKSNKMLVVANYNPPGNYTGKFVENVPKLTE